MELDVDRSIAAPRDRIWAILSDAQGYGSWDNGIELVDGEIAPGSKCRMIPEDGDLQLKVNVVEFEPHERMVWKVRLSLGMASTREFVLTESPDGTTYFRMHEVFSGRSAAKKMPDLEMRFRRFADGLKHHAETTV